MDVKEKIITATIDIIQTEKDFASITIRKIAAKAGIGVGLINYHFQSKENLVNVTVRHFINSIITQWNNVLPLPVSPSKIDLLISMLLATAEFMATFPGISKISILNDLSNPNPDDNTMHTFQGILPVLHAFESDNAVNAGIEVIACLQWRFLRNDIFKHQFNDDFFNKDQRESFVKNLVTKHFEKL